MSILGGYVDISQTTLGQLWASDAGKGAGFRNKPVSMWV